MGRTGLSWLRTGSSVGFFWTLRWAFGFHKENNIFWYAEWQSAFQIIFCTTE
jgi:hypothetical protein